MHNLHFTYLNLRLYCCPLLLLLYQYKRCRVFRDLSIYVSKDVRQ